MSSASSSTDRRRRISGNYIRGMNHRGRNFESPRTTSSDGKVDSFNSRQDSEVSSSHGHNWIAKTVAGSKSRILKEDHSVFRGSKSEHPFSTKAPEEPDKHSSDSWRDENLSFVSQQPVTSIGMEESGVGKLANPTEYAGVKKNHVHSDAQEQRADPGLKLSWGVYSRGLLSQENEDYLGPSIIGTCPDMCPIKEREQRERLQDLAIFERVNSNPRKTSRDLAVKKFCRTLSVKELAQSDVRPLLVLSKALQYLLKLLDRTEYQFELLHDFLSDRMRAIRQELGMQRITNRDAIRILEQIVRFHILSEHELHKTESLYPHRHLNLEQLSKALLSLLDNYLKNKDGYENQPEFYSYYILLNLKQVQQLSLWFRTVNPLLLKTREMQFARAVLKSFHLRNFYLFFQLIKEATYLQACLMELYLNEVRGFALSMINYGGYKLHSYSIQHLALSFLMREEDAQDFCKRHGLLVTVGTNNVPHVVVKQTEWKIPEAKGEYPCLTIDEKRHQSYFEEVLKIR